MSSVLRGNPESATSTSAGRARTHSDPWIKKDRELRVSYQWPLRGVRKFTINPQVSDDLYRFPSNEMRAHRFRWYNAIIKAFWLQLFRLPNPILLLLVILEFISPNSEVAERAMAYDTRVLCFLVPVFLSSWIALYEDWRRHRLSRTVNDRPCVVIDGRNPHFLSVSRSDLRVGQIVRVHNNEEIPADCLLLCSSSADAKACVSQELVTGSRCLLRKSAVKETRFEISASAVANISGQVLCNEASADLDRFFGALRLQAHPRGTTLDSRSFMCQGSILRNTDWIYCLTLFTGPDTKVARSHSPVQRMSQRRKIVLEAKIALISCFLFGAVCLASLISSINAWQQVGHLASDPQIHGSVNVLFRRSTSSHPFFLLTEYLLLFSSVISPALLLVLDIISLLTGKRAERAMRQGLVPSFVDPLAASYSRGSSTGEKKRSGMMCQVSDSASLKNLGCVDFLLTDKTGTLTTNKPLKFVLCSVGKRIYGKCFRHKPATARSHTRPFTARTSPACKVKVKKREDLKPSLKRRTISSMAVTPTSNDIAPDTPEPGQSRGTTRKVFRFDENFQAPPGPSIAQLLTLSDRESIAGSESIDSEPGQSRSFFERLNANNIHLSLRGTHFPSLHQRASDLRSELSRQRGSDPPSSHTEAIRTFISERVYDATIPSSVSAGSFTPLRKRESNVGSKRSRLKDSDYCNAASSDESIETSSKPVWLPRRAPIPSHSRAPSAPLPQRQRSLAASQSGGFQKTCRRQSSSFSRSEAQSRRSHFREGGPEAASMVDFDDAKILKDLRRGGARSALLDEFIKGLILCNMISTDLPVQPYSTLASPTTSFDDFNNASHNYGSAFTISSPGLDLGARDSDDLSRFSSQSRDVPTESFSNLAAQALLASITYESVLPEEITLVYAAHKLGYGLLTRTKKGIVIEINGKFHRYEKLFSLDFTSSRKRVLTVLRREDEAEATVYVRGAASVVFDLLGGKNDHGSTEILSHSRSRRDSRGGVDDLKAISAKHAQRFVLRGYRAVALAKRRLTAIDVGILSRRVEGLSSCSPHQRDLLCNTLADELETGLDILGVIGLQESLFPDVSRTITTLVQSGVRIWMVTGDDHENAISTACQAQLIRPNMKLLRIELSRADADSFSEVVDMYDTFKEEVETRAIDQELACFITGEDFNNFCAASDLQTLLMCMLCQCEVVLICEVSAVQKGTVARILRTRITPTPTILSVGDGLNDIAMFKESHVSVAVGQRDRHEIPISPSLNEPEDYPLASGVEEIPLDARLHADLNIPSFGYLRPLLMEHGRNALGAGALWTRASTVLGCMQFLPIILQSASSQWIGVPLWTRTGMGVMAFLTMGIVCCVTALHASEFGSLIMWHLPALYCIARRRGLMNTRVLLYDLCYAGLVSFCFSLTARQVTGGQWSLGTDGKVQDCTGTVAICIFLGLYVGGIVFITYNTLTRKGLWFWVSVVVCFAGPLELLMLPYTAEFFYSTYIDKVVNAVEDLDAVLRWGLITVSFFGLSLTLAVAVRRIQIAMAPDAVEVFRYFVVYHKSKFMKERLSKRLESESPETIGNEAIVKSTSVISNPTSCPNHFEGLEKSDEVAFACFVRNVLNPLRVRRMAGLLPYPRQFYLKQPGKSRHFAVQLPFTAAIDKVTDAALRRNTPETVGSNPKETVAGSNRGPRRWGAEIEFGIYRAKEVEQSGLPLRNRLVDQPSEPARMGDASFFYSEIQGNNDEDSFGTGDSLVSSDENTARHSGIGPTDAHEKGEVVGAFKETNVHVSELINMLELTFKDQQLEADYQVHRRQHITQYRLSYRLSFLFLCVVTIMMVLQEMLGTVVGTVPIERALVGFIPYLISVTLFISSHYDFLFINYFDVLLGGLVLCIAFFQLLSDTLLFKDGVSSTAIYSVLIFIFFRIPFLHAVCYNLIHFFAFTLRYALTVAISEAAHDLRDGFDPMFRQSNPTSSLAAVTSQNFPAALEAVSLNKLATYLPVLLGIEAFTGFAAYRLEYNRRKAFLLDYQVEKTRKRQTEILHTMLPAFVVEHMLNGPFNKNGVPVGLKAEDRGTVSVVFCDVYDFQNIVASVAPTHLVKVLDSLFLCFDKCAERFGCTKIETVFETYLAAAGIKLEGKTSSNGDADTGTPSENAFDALCMALIMLRFSRHVTYVATEQALSPSEIRSMGAYSSDDGSSDTVTAAAAAAAAALGESNPRTSRSSDAKHRKVKRIRVKIGIHSGRVISGVVGAKKPQYALFGDTVNTASRMKTTGRPDHIHVSSATHDLVKTDNCLKWEERLIEVKGKGLMTTYLLTRVELPQDYSGAPRRHNSASAEQPFAPPRYSRSNVPPTRDNTEDLSQNQSAENLPLPSAPDSTTVHPSLETKRTGARTPSMYGSTPAIVSPAEQTDPFADLDVADEFGDPALMQSNPTRVDALWSRFQRQYSRDLRNGSSTNQLERMPPEQDKHADRNLLQGSHADSIVEETVFVACMRYIKKHGNKRDGAAAHTQPQSTDTKHFRAHQINPHVHWTSLTFKDKYLEDRYKTHYYSNPSNINHIEQAIIIFLATYVIQTLVFVAIPRYESMWIFQAEAAVTWTVRSIFTITSFALWLMLHFRDRTPFARTRFGTKWVVFLANFTFMTSAFAVMLESSWSIDFPEDIKPFWLHVDTLQLFFFITILHHNSGLLVQHVMLVNLVVLAVVIPFITTVTQRTGTTREALFLIPLFILANVFSVFFKEYVDRQSFIVNEDMQEMEDRGKELLRDMLPKEVLEELQQENLKLAYKHDKMTFIFADICGFTTWADTVDASEVVTVLQSLFAKFDRDSTRFGVFKVCTIGDAYVAVSEPVTDQYTHQGFYDPAIGAERVLAMAQCMIRDIKTVREKLNIPSLNMRIGLHFGSCVGGVIGSGRLRYDLWGLDVLTGNLMESNGVPGRICMSQQLVDFLDEKFPGRFHFVFHRTVQVTNRVVNAYLLVTEKYSFDTGSGALHQINPAKLSMHQVPAPYEAHMRRAMYNPSSNDTEDSQNP